MMNPPLQITLLGSTGSIGMSTLQVISCHAERFRVFALTAHKSVLKLAEQCLAYHPKYAVLGTAKAAKELSKLLQNSKNQTEVLFGKEALAMVASHSEVDYVMAGIVGAAGLVPTMSAARSGKRVLLANKESLVMAGSLMIDAARKSHAILMPVDSEQSAIFQCLPPSFKTGERALGVKKITLTASGGAFRERALDTLETVTPKEACYHPNWSMGAKITVDSATMMNKGLEVIEAHWLFGMPPEDIQTILHPQSIIHSWVEYADGSTIAQLGLPDMRIPIAYALSWPERIESGVDRLDLSTVGRLDFEPLCPKRFPSLELAYAALQKGGTAPAILNAANEVAVQAFLEGKIRFTAICKVVEKTLENAQIEDVNSLEGVLEADKEARRLSQIYCNL